MKAIPGFAAIVTNALRVLTSAQRAIFYRAIGSSLVISILDWISLAALVPLLFKVRDGNSSNHSFVPSIQEQPITLIAGACIFVFIFKTLLSSLLQRRQIKTMNAFYIHLSERMYADYFSQSLLSFTGANESDNFRKVKQTAFDFAHNVLYNIILLATDLATFSVITIFLIFIDYRVIVALIAIGLPSGIIFHFIKTRWIRKIDQSFRELTPVSNVILSHGIQSFAEAKIYHVENYFITTFLKSITQTSDLLGRLKILIALPSKIAEIVGITSFVFIILFGDALLAGNDLIIFIGLLSLAVYKVMPSLTRMMATTAQLQSYGYAIDEIKPYTKDVSQKNREQSNVNFTENIRLNNVSFHYQGAPKKLIASLTTEIRKGDFVVLTGASGTGKSTLINILAGLLQPTSGIIQVDGQSLNSSTLKSWQQRIGYVPQTAVIHNDSMLNNIIFTKDGDVDHTRLQRAIDSAGLLDFIVTLPEGLNTVVGEKGMRFSGGQRQRLALARALYRNPEVLLLDEVTNQLDEENKILILKKLKSMTQSGTTIIISSHDPIVRSYATKEISLYVKKIHAQGASLE